MSKLLLGCVAAGLLFLAVPASAQDVGVSVGERGVRVGVGNERDRDYRRHNDRTRVYTDGRGHRGGCVEVTTKRRLPNGNVIIKKRERC
jgi:hypothetical protein